MAIRAHSIIQDYQGQQAPTPGPSSGGLVSRDVVFRLTQEELQRLATTTATIAAERVRDKLNSEINSLAEQVTELTEEQGTLEERVTELEEERDNLSTNVTTLTAERDNLSANVTTLTTERDNLSNHVTQITTQRRAELIEAARRLRVEASRLDKESDQYAYYAKLAALGGLIAVIPSFGLSLGGLGVDIGFTVHSFKCNWQACELSQEASRLEQLAAQPPASQTTQSQAEEPPAPQVETTPTVGAS